MWLANKTYFSDITVNNIYQSFTHKMAATASWHRNYVTVTLCILQCDWTVSPIPRALKNSEISKHVRV